MQAAGSYQYLHWLVRSIQAIKLLSIAFLRKYHCAVAWLTPFRRPCGPFLVFEMAGTADANQGGRAWQCWPHFFVPDAGKRTKRHMIYIYYIYIYYIYHIYILYYILYIIYIYIICLYYIYILYIYIFVYLSIYHTSIMSSLEDTRQTVVIWQIREFRTCTRLDLPESRWSVQSLPAGADPDTKTLRTSRHLVGGF